MQTLQAPSHSLQPQETSSRHDEQMLVTRIVPVDPYEAWMEQREAERRSTMTERTTPAGRFIRSRPSRVGRPERVTDSR